MKPITLITLICVLSLIQLKAQTTYHRYSPTDSDFISIDNTTDNSWEIYKDSTVSTYDGNVDYYYSMTTKKNGNYPADNSSSFTLKLSCGYIEEFTLLFNHRYETTKNKDGGFIEISYDLGESWINIVSDTTNIGKPDPLCEIEPDIPCHSGLYVDSLLYSISDTIRGGIPSVNGLNDTLTQVSFTRGYGEFFAPDSIYIRFTFLSDNESDTLSGWTISNIETFQTVLLNAEKIQVHKEPRIYPNPITINSVINIKNCIDEEFEMMLYNSNGSLLYKQHYWGDSNIIHLPFKDLVSGIYVCKLTSSVNSYSLKFIVEN